MTMFLTYIFSDNSFCNWQLNVSATKLPDTATNNKNIPRMNERSKCLLASLDIINAIYYNAIFILTKLFIVRQSI